MKSQNVVQLQSINSVVCQWKIAQKTSEYLKYETKQKSTLLENNCTIT